MLKILLALFFSFLSLPVFAQDYDGPLVLSDIEQIDVPTASSLDHYAFRFGSRLYSGGGTQLRLGFGVHDRLTIGAYFMVDGLIGDSTHVKVREPEIEVKFRFWDGGYHIPSLAIGFDGQGYFYSDDRKKYLEDERGLYLVATSEIFPALFVNGGFNMSDFDDNKVYGFIGANYTLDEVVTLMLEYDNLFHHTLSRERLNAGLRVHITSDFSLDAAVREINASGRYLNGEKHRPERIIQLRYMARF